MLNWAISRAKAQFIVSPFVGIIFLQLDTAYCVMSEKSCFAYFISFSSYLSQEDPFVAVNPL